MVGNKLTRIITLNTDWLIGWCLIPTLEIFQLYCVVNKFYY